MKRIFMILIVIAAIAGAGVFLYMMLTGAQEPVVAPQTASSAILPFGTELDFESIEKFNPTGRQFQYPTVTPSDAGVTLGSLMKQ